MSLAAALRAAVEVSTSCLRRSISEPTVSVEFTAESLAAARKTEAEVSTSCRSRPVSEAIASVELAAESFAAARNVGGRGFDFGPQAIGEGCDGVTGVFRRILSHRPQGGSGGFDFEAQAIGQRRDGRRRIGGGLLGRRAQGRRGRLDLRVELTGQSAKRTHRTCRARVDRGEQILAPPRHQAEQTRRLLVESLHGAFARIGDLAGNLIATRCRSA